MWGDALVNVSQGGLEESPPPISVEPADLWEQMKETKGRSSNIKSRPSLLSIHAVEMELGGSTLALNGHWTSGCVSEAMDKLMLLTGLKKVKAV